MQDDTQRVMMIYRRLSNLSQEISSLLSSESDRGCALWAAAMLDDKLEELLRSIFIDDRKEVDKFLKDMGSLATFSARVKLAYLLGIINKDDYKQYTAIRKIRNEFAHNTGNLNYNDHVIAKHCNTLKRPIIKGLELSNRQKYIMAITVFLEILQQRIETLKPLLLQNVYSTVLEVEQAIYQQMDIEKEE